MDEKICGLRLGFQYKIYDILKWSSRPIWKGVCVLGLTNIYLLNFTYDNNTVDMVFKTHLERRVLGLVLAGVCVCVLDHWDMGFMSYYHICNI